MLMGTLKETLVFKQNDNVGSHRYEIYKNDSKGGYFAVIYMQKNIVADGSFFITWVIENSHHDLRSHYIPNARMECESHWKENYLAVKLL